MAFDKSYVFSLIALLGKPAVAPFNFIFFAIDFLMQIATVLGQTTATVKHDTLEGWRMLVVQPLDARGGDDGFPIVAVDHLGARHGDQVLITCDGNGVREIVGAKNTPVRWAVMGVIDE